MPRPTPNEYESIDHQQIPTAFTMSATMSGKLEHSTASTGTGCKNTDVSKTSLTQSIEKCAKAIATGQSNCKSWQFRIIQILKEKDLLSAIGDSDTPLVQTKMIRHLQSLL